MLKTFFASEGRVCSSNFSRVFYKYIFRDFNNTRVVFLQENNPRFYKKELCGHLQNTRLVELDSGHAPYFETPEVFITVLRDFLNND